MGHNYSATVKPARVVPASTVIGIPLACMWALHAAGTYVPWQKYVTVPLLLSWAVALLIWRTRSRQLEFGFKDKIALVSALGMWLAGAALSLILNWNTPQVLLTDVTVFGCGLAVFIALAGLKPGPHEIHIGIVGLALGSLPPLIGGVQAFVGEFGIQNVVEIVSAYRNPIRMASYEDATFGSRGNTAAFLVMLAPILVSIVLDVKTSRTLRIGSAVMLVPIGLNLTILQSRAGFITLLASLAVVWTFRFGVRRLPIFALVIAAGWILLIRSEPDLEWMVSTQYMPVLTADGDSDLSVGFRLDAIAEGWRLFEQNWLVGIGPGGASSRHSLFSAHQFQVQQAMETGILGLLGSTLVVVCVWGSLGRVMVRRREETNDMRFLLLIGPAAYLLYAVLGNAPLSTGTLNIWAVLPVSMLALCPPFEARRCVTPVHGLAASLGWRRVAQTVAADRVLGVTNGRRLMATGVESGIPK